MNDERAGQLNEQDLLMSLAERIEVLLRIREISDRDAALMFVVFREMGLELVKRGLINELGIEILKRDGVIPPSPQSHDKPPSEPS